MGHARARTVSCPRTKEEGSRSAADAAGAEKRLHVCCEPTDRTRERRRSLPSQPCPRGARSRRAGPGARPWEAASSLRPARRPSRPRHGSQPQAGDGAAAASAPSGSPGVAPEFPLAVTGESRGAFGAVSQPSPEESGSERAACQAAPPASLQRAQSSEGPVGPAFTQGATARLPWGTSPVSPAPPPAPPRSLSADVCVDSRNPCRGAAECRARRVAGDGSSRRDGLRGEGPLLPSSLAWESGSTARPACAPRAPGLHVSLPCFLEQWLQVCGGSHGVRARGQCAAPADVASRARARPLQKAGTAAPPPGAVSGGQGRAVASGPGAGLAQSARRHELRAGVPRTRRHLPRTCVAPEPDPAPPLLTAPTATASDGSIRSFVLALPQAERITCSSFLFVSLREYWPPNALEL